MITKEYTMHALICDICQNEADERFMTFEDAVAYKKENWHTRRIVGKKGVTFIDVCEKCGR
jgi:hypothetical protein